ncbi:MAG: SGNH/GDSL hydrolase family protein [Lentisphaeraceae bacterium]|nr:SGNH/GDSL hydrolase family protein [Lentisphaeraceae bacterium]
MSFLKNLALLLLLLLVSSCQSTSVKIDDLESKKVLFLGDSITNNGLYVSFFEYYLFKSGINADVISVGLGSETTSGLSENAHPFPRPCVHTRIDNILKETKPEIVVFCYGMNDGIYHPQSPERMKAYRDGVNSLINKIETVGAKVIIMTPPPFDPVPIAKKTVDKLAADFSYKTPYKGYNDVLGDYADWLMTLDYPVVDQNGLLSEYLKLQRKSDPSFKFSGDGIHPNPEGHLLMSKALLHELSLSDARNIKVSDAESLLKDPLFKKVHKRRSMRSKAWLEYIGYTRGKVVKKASVTAEEKASETLKTEILKAVQ